MKMTVEELGVIIANHKKWINDEDGGTRAVLSGAVLSWAVLRNAVLSGAVLSGAVLSGAVLSGAVLRNAVLSGADLRNANLSGADLRNADLSGADLSGAVLSGADLRNAVLRNADLSWAVLSGADLRNADLSGADLRHADLRNANLSGADLSGADLRNVVNASTAFAMTSITPGGDLIGYKKCLNGTGGYCIVKLKIPADAKRSNASGRKCRAEWAEVLEVDGAEVGISSRSTSFVYVRGEIVRPDKWDDNRWNECASGIHFFITREEAEAYDL